MSSVVLLSRHSPTPSHSAFVLLIVRYVCACAHRLTPHDDCACHTPRIKCTRSRERPVVVFEDRHSAGGRWQKTKIWLCLMKKDVNIYKYEVFKSNQEKCMFIDTRAPWLKCFYKPVARRKSLTNELAWRGSYFLRGHLFLQFDIFALFFLDCSFMRLPPSSGDSWTLADWFQSQYFSTSSVSHWIHAETVRQQ